MGSQMKAGCRALNCYGGFKDTEFLNVLTRLKRQMDDCRIDKDEPDKIVYEGAKAHKPGVSSVEPNNDPNQLPGSREEQKDEEELMEVQQEVDAMADADPTAESAMPR